MTFQPGDIIVNECDGKRKLRMVVSLMECGYVVRNLHGGESRFIRFSYAEACWRKVGGEI